MRNLQRPGPDSPRDEFPAGCVCHLRDLQGPAIQRGNPEEVPWLQYCRDSRSACAGGSRSLPGCPSTPQTTELLSAVGLDYLSLGQQSHTLSGGEAQRIKLVEELAKKSAANALYLMDEPSTGLHMHDVGKLIEVIQRLVDRGDTVCVIEHNMDIIASADWLVEMGPQGGEDGGHVLFSGTPASLVKIPKHSITAPFLKEHLAGKLTAWPLDDQD